MTCPMFQELLVVVEVVGVVEVAVVGVLVGVVVVVVGEATVNVGVGSNLVGEESRNRSEAGEPIVRPKRRPLDGKPCSSAFSFLCDSREAESLFGLDALAAEETRQESVSIRRFD